MNNHLTDIGINLTNKQFQNDTESIIQSAIDAEVAKMILTGTSIRNNEQSAVLAKKYPNVLYATAGIHPHDAKSFDAQSIAKFRALSQECS
jgi:TatD DNase family protein